MDTEVCTHCGGSFRTKRARKTHEIYCIGNKAPRLENEPVVSFSSRSIEGSEITRPTEAAGPSASPPPEVPILFDLDEANYLDCNDYVEEDMFDHPYIESPIDSFDSTFSLWQWIRSTQRTAGLSKNDIDRLFKILLHPSFRVESLKVKSAADVQNYEQSFYTEDNSWCTRDVLGYNFNFREPLGALELLYSSPANAENFTLIPSEELDGVEKVYSSPDTGTWWHSMQVRNSTIVFICKKKIISIFYDLLFLF